MIYFILIKMVDIIVNADDFGLSEETVESTIKLFELNAISSATIMLSKPGTNQAIEYAKKNPQFSYGLHLNFVRDEDDRPLTHHKEISSLTTNDGFFLRTNQLRKKALLNLIDPSHICLETIAQINELSNLGIKISHLDSHGHIHKFPIFSKAIGSIKNQTNIHKVRNYQNIFLKNKFLSPTFWLGPLFKKNINKYFKTTNFFFMNLNKNDFNWPKNLFKLNIFGSLEIGVHPGSKENWRIKEFESCLIISEIMKKNKKYNLINWNHL